MALVLAGRRGDRHGGGSGRGGARPARSGSDRRNQDGAQRHRLPRRRRRRSHAERGRDLRPRSSAVAVHPHNAAYRPVGHLGAEPVGERLRRGDDGDHVRGQDQQRHGGRRTLRRWQGCQAGQDDPRIRRRARALHRRGDQQGRLGCDAGGDLRPRSHAVEQGRDLPATAGAPVRRRSRHPDRQGARRRRSDLRARRLERGPGVRERRLPVWRPIRDGPRSSATRTLRLVPRSKRRSRAFRAIRAAIF